jgi:hypothetical protein
MIPAFEQVKTFHALDRAATVMGMYTSSLTETVPRKCVTASARCSNISSQIHNDADHISDEFFLNLAGQINKWKTAGFMQF